MINKQFHSRQWNLQRQSVSVPPQMPPSSQICLTAAKFGDNVTQHFHFISLMWFLLQSLHVQLALMCFLGGDNQRKQKPRKQSTGCCFGCSTPRGTLTQALPKGTTEARSRQPRPGRALLCWGCKWVVVQSQLPGCASRILLLSTLLQVQGLLPSCGYSRSFKCNIKS